MVMVPASSCWCMACSSNSVVILAISGPATIQRLSAPGLPVSPIAPPEPFTIALFCSWNWSSAMAENLFLVLCTTKFPDLNSARISGCFACSKSCHVTDMYRKPSGVVCVIQGKHPGHDLRQGFHIQREVTFTKGPDVSQQEQSLKPIIKVSTAVCTTPQKLDYPVAWNWDHQTCSLRCKLFGGVHKGLQLSLGVHGES